MTSKKYVKGKLKSLEDVFDISGKSMKLKKSWSISYSKGDKRLSIFHENFHKFGQYIDIRFDHTWKNPTRTIYRDREKTFFYDELFEYIGDSIDHIPAELWDLDCDV